MMIKLFLLFSMRGNSSVVDYEFVSGNIYKIEKAYICLKDDNYKICIKRNPTIEKKILTLEKFEREIVLTEDIISKGE